MPHSKEPRALQGREDVRANEDGSPIDSSAWDGIGPDETAIIIHRDYLAGVCQASAARQVYRIDALPAEWVDALALDASEMHFDAIAANVVDRVVEEMPQANIDLPALAKIIVEEIGREIAASGLNGGAQAGESLDPATSGPETPSADPEPTSGLSRGMAKAADIMDQACLPETLITNGLDAALREDIAAALSQAYEDGRKDEREICVRVTQIYADEAMRIAERSKDDAQTHGFWSYIASQHREVISSIQEQDAAAGEHCHCTDDPPLKAPDWRPHDRSLCAELARLRSENASLRRALEPFAASFDPANYDGDPDEAIIIDEYELRHYRRARAVLRGTEAP